MIKNCFSDYPNLLINYVRKGCYYYSQPFFKPIKQK